MDKGIKVGDYVQWTREYGSQVVGKLGQVTTLGIGDNWIRVNWVDGTTCDTWINNVGKVEVEDVI